MEKYWKLLDLKEHEYSVHETEEEINHIIEFKTRNMEDDRVIRRIDIKTPFSNYNFQYVVAFDSENIFYFLYFFDSIEEELDSRDDDRDEIKEQRDRAIKLLNEKTTALFNANRTIEFLRKRISELETDDSERSEIAYLKERILSKEKRIDVLEAGLKESERNTEYWKSRCRELEEMLEKIRNVVSEFCYPF